MNKARFKTIDAYIKSFPKEVGARLNAMREIVETCAPSAEGYISYNMPAYKWYGVVVYFAAFTHHIGFYPFPSAIKAFQKESSRYKTSKGSIQFPLDKPLPRALIRKIVKFRMKENSQKIVRQKK